MVKKMGTITLMCIVQAAACPVHGQQSDNNLGSLWPRVEQYYPGIGAKQAAIDAVQLKEKSVKGNMLPQVKAQAQNAYGTYEGSAGAFFPQPGFFNVSGASGSLDRPTLSPTAFGSATLEWELFSFGKLRKESEAAHALTEKAIGDKAAYLLTLKKTLSDRYISLVYSEAKLNWNTKNVERLDDIRKITSGLSSSGLKPAADSLLALSSYTQSLGDNDRLTGNRNASLIKLLELYGGDTLNYSSSVARFNAPLNQTYAQERKLVSPSHPLLTILDRQAHFYTLSSEVQKKSMLPSLRLLGGYAYRSTGVNPNGTVSGHWKDGFSNTTNNFIAGIGITWNITGLHINHLKSAALSKDAEGAKLQHRQYELAMQAELSSSQVRITQQYEQVQKTNSSVKQAQDAYSMYLARYKSGLIGLTELLQIRILLEQAENNHIEAAREYWMLLSNEAELTANFDFLFNNL